MRGLILVGVFILLYQTAVGKPLKKKMKTESTELIREKRSELEEDEKSSEMQKFMLDLSSKEDMSRLQERFKSGTTRDIENDAEYRRLKRFSIQGDDDVEGKRMTSDEDVTNDEEENTERAGEDYSNDTPEDNTEMDGDTSRRSEDGMETPEDSSERSETNEKQSDGQSKRSEDGMEDSKDSSQPSETNDKSSNDKSNRAEGETMSIYELGIENSYNENERDKNVDFTSRNTADSETTASDVNSHHVVGGSWELVHHYPTGSLSTLANVNTTHLNNTTMHSEYLQDDDMGDVMQFDSDDVTQYERAGKSRRKPRARSVEPDYEVREISEVDKQTPEKLLEDHGHVVTLNTRAIKRDGYIGCFIDQHPNRDLKRLFTVNNLTPHSCRSVCKAKGHVYAGVQYGYLCHCGDEYGKYGEAGEHECDSVCLGDEQKKCGGFWRNSVYTSEIPDTDDSEVQQEDITGDRETRSHIDRVIPLSQSERDEIPVHQEITVYLKAEIPKRPEILAVPAKRTSVPATNSKRSKIPTGNGDKVNQPRIVPNQPKNVVNVPSNIRDRPNAGVKPQTNIPDQQSNAVSQPSNVVQTKTESNINYNAYLHPQKSQPDFIPSNVVLRTMTSSPEKKKYIGFVKLRQNWDDTLQNKRSPKTLILAGNVESAFAEMFAEDPKFEKAEVLSLREAAIRDNPDTVHKVLVEFALVFEKKARKKDRNLKKMVENNGRVGDMPVFADSLDVKEYSDEEDETAEEEDESARKETRRDGVDAFLEEVFKQI